MTNISIKSRAQGLLNANRLAEAKTLYMEACRLVPSDAEAWHMLGAINGMLGLFSESEACAREVIRLVPGAAPAFNNLGAALLAQDKADQAIAAFRKALKLNKNDPEALNNLGNAWLHKEEFSRACDYYKESIRLKPGQVEAYNNLGSALLNLHRPADALTCLEFALQINPRYPDALFNYGKALQALGRFAQAMTAFEQARQLQPDNTDILFGMGDLLREQGDYKQAIRYLTHILDREPDNAKVLGALAGIKKDCGRLDEAISLYQQATEIDPDIPGLYSNYLMTLNYIDHPATRDLFALHKAWGESLEKKLPPGFRFPGKPKKKRLTIGYVSHDFRTHSVAYFFEPVLSSHNRDNFRILCYSTMGKHQEDETTHRIMDKADTWRDITHLTDKDAATCIYNDKVDLMVDLSGHTAWNRLGVFALRPAPVQLTYIGYPNTTGLSTIDYRIVDEITDPDVPDCPGGTEKLIRLPHAFLTYSPPPVPVSTQEAPCLHNKFITFGSFNALPKVTPRVVETWCQLLDAVEGSRLLLKNSSFIDSSVRVSILDSFINHNIDPSRVELIPPCRSTAEHLGLYNRVDIALDTFPYNGTTTTCEALWMGVPVVALRGTSHASRVGLSILHEIGMEELAAYDLQGYIQAASDLANDRQRIESFRHTLRERLSGSMLGKHSKFTRCLEGVYETLWQEYIATRAGASGQNRNQARQSSSGVTTPQGNE